MILLNLKLSGDESKDQETTPGRCDGTPYLKDKKTLKKSEHLEAQQWSIDLLKSKGYAACFAVGFDQVKSYIEKYLALEK